MPAEPDFPTFATATRRSCSARRSPSAAEGRWVEVAAVKLGLLTAAFPD